jgi:SAM-dependent methyltransferase
VAATTDRHALYQDAVQTPTEDVKFFTNVYRERRGRDPMALREDFCGTAYLATEWVKSHPQRTAIAVDLDEATLEWGREHNLEAADEDVARRVRLIHSDVLDVREPRVDLTCAMNFSYCVFKTREALRRYFEVVYEGLNDDGVFVTELYGGTEAITEDEEERPVGSFCYKWQCEKYNPITHETLCHITFVFPDGSKLRRAFTYDWRLWTIPELRELLNEVGFDSVTVYWENVDEDGDGTGEFRATEEEENQESWLVYVVAAKS